MIKKYTDSDYADKSIEANREEKYLYVYTREEEIEIDIPDFELVEETKTIVEYDDEGTPTEKEETETVEKPVMIEQTITDDEGNEQTIKVQSTHKETITQEVAELLISDYGYYICYKDNWTDGTINPDFDTNRITKLRTQLNEENTTKAKESVENGYVEFKNAQFETNAQTVGDLTATMLLMQASGLETYEWLSKDDKVIELTLEDFGTLGGLIAGFKAHIWNEEYFGYKEQIENAQSYEELKEIVIDYGAGE